MKTTFISAIVLASGFVGVMAAPAPVALAAPAAAAIAHPAEFIVDKRKVAVDPVAILTTLIADLKAPLASIETAAQGVIAVPSTATMAIENGIQMSLVTVTNKINKAAKQLQGVVPTFSQLFTIIFDLASIIKSVNQAASLESQAFGSASATTDFSATLTALNTLLADFASTTGGSAGALSGILNSILSSILGDLNSILSGLTL